MDKEYFDYEEAAMEESTNALFAEICENLKYENSKPAVINPARVKDFIKALGFLKKYAKSNRSKISYKMHSPFKWMGCISLIGSNIYFDFDTFSAVAKLATVIDIYPRTNGTIQIDFMFNDLTVSQ